MHWFIALFSFPENFNSINKTIAFSLSKFINIFLMKIIFTFCLLTIAFHSFAQHDFIVLEKNGSNVKTYSEGIEINVETIYRQWFEGVITAVRHDSVFINGFPFHYKEIATIKRDRNKLNYEADGVLLMAAGVGVVILGAVNGWYRGDNAGTWYSSTSYITAAGLIAGGYLLKNARYKYYHLGKKYKLTYLSLDPNKK